MRALAAFAGTLLAGAVAVYDLAHGTTDPIARYVAAFAAGAIGVAIGERVVRWIVASAREAAEAEIALSVGLTADKSSKPERPVLEGARETIDLRGQTAADLFDGLAAATHRLAETATMLRDAADDLSAAGEESRVDLLVDEARKAVDLQATGSAHLIEELTAATARLSEAATALRDAAVARSATDIAPRSRSWREITIEEPISLELPTSLVDDVDAQLQNTPGEIDTSDSLSSGGLPRSTGAGLKPIKIRDFPSDWKLNLDFPAEAGAAELPSDFPFSQRAPAAEAEPPDMPAAAESMPHAAPPPPADEEPRDRAISAWVAETENAPETPLRIGSEYTLRFKVGSPMVASLFAGEAVIVRRGSIPVGGLPTRWVVRSSSVKFSPADGTAAVIESNAGFWVARFDLTIPDRSDSEVRSLTIEPISEEARIDLLIYSGADLYRELAATLRVTGSPEVGKAVTIEGDTTYVALTQLGLLPPHEWTTPPDRVGLAIRGGVVNVESRKAGDSFLELWEGTSSTIAGPVTNVRNAAERFRAQWDVYLDDIDPDDLRTRLGSHWIDVDWASLGDRADQKHKDAWNEVSASTEFREMASAGYSLYESCFPRKSTLRNYIDARQPGTRLDITWFDADRGALASIPWPLMYCVDPDTELEATKFLGLRYRIAYTAHQARNVSKALGAPAATHRLNYLYWGRDPKDEVAAEAEWQRKEWSAWLNQKFVPLAGDSTPKLTIRKELLQPDPAPANLLYLFCHCATGKGNAPVLRFGTTNDDSEVFSEVELPTSDLTDKPIVFANACATAASDPYFANELEMKFFRRGCRAFIGTETKVPIHFASRFASIFFHYFYLNVGNKPIAAGEALALTRTFLWTNFRNIGGLFYSYVNQYELFMATEQDLDSLRRDHV